MKLSTICYLEENGKTLVLYRNKKAKDMHQGKYVGIGGKFENQETPEECVSREFFEETGLHIIAPEMKGVIFFPSFYQGEDWIMFVFHCKQSKGRMIDSDEGTLCWVETEQLGELPMWEGDYLFLDWMREDGFFSARMLYQDQKLLSHTVTRYKQ